MTRRTSLAGVLAATAFLAAPPVVVALTSTLLNRSTLSDPADVNNDRIKFKTKGPTDIHVQEARFAPGDAVSWHHHPGFALIAVKSGTMTFYDAQCTAHTIGAGRAFVETGGPTRTVNLGGEEAVVHVTYVVPQGTPRTEPAAPPPCA